MADDIKVTRTNETEYVRTYTEKEIAELLARDLISRVEVEHTALGEVEHKLYTESRDGSTGPYRVYRVTIVAKHGDES